MAGGETARGREKQISSPNGEQRKKKGSLFRRASLSRKKNKEEQRQRSKSKALGFLVCRLFRRVATFRVIDIFRETENFQAKFHFLGWF